MLTHPNLRSQKWEVKRWLADCRFHRLWWFSQHHQCCWFAQRNWWVSSGVLLQQKYSSYTSFACGVWLNMVDFYNLHLQSWSIMCSVAHLSILANPAFTGCADLFCLDDLLAEMKAAIGRLFNDPFMSSSLIGFFLNPEGRVQTRRRPIDICSVVAACLVCSP